MEASDYGGHPQESRETSRRTRDPSPAVGQQAGEDEQRVLEIVLGRWTPTPQERDCIAAAFGLTPTQYVSLLVIGSKPEFATKQNGKWTRLGA